MKDWFVSKRTLSADGLVNLAVSQVGGGGGGVRKVSTFLRRHKKFAFSLERGQKSF